MRTIIGIDLGTINDYTSVAVVEQHGKASPKIVTGVIGSINVGWRPSRGIAIDSLDEPGGAALARARLAAANSRATKEEEPEERASYRLRHLERHLGDPYTRIVERIQELIGRMEGRPRLIVDGTGVGRPVVDLMIEKGLRNVVPVIITGGDDVSDAWVNGRTEYRVPKRDLVGTIQVLLENRLLKIPKALDLGDELTREMQNFKVKLSDSTGHASYEHWRSGDHDDLVLALALATWYAENY